MVNINKLRDAIKSSGYSIASLSLEIGIDESTFYRKINKEGSTFTLAQADAIKNALRMNATDAQEIFFATDDACSA